MGVQDKSMKGYRTINRNNLTCLLSCDVQDLYLVHIALSWNKQAFMKAAIETFASIYINHEA